MKKDVLNLLAMEYFLTVETTAGEIADNLDNIIRDFNSLTSECNLINDVQAMINCQLISLRDLFIKTALDNGEKLEYSMLKKRFTIKEGDN